MAKSPARRRRPPRALPDKSNKKKSYELLSVDAARVRMAYDVIAKLHEALNLMRHIAGSMRSEAEDRHGGSFMAGEQRE